MQKIHSLLLGFIITLFSLQALALQVSLQSSGTNIMVSNDRELSEVDIYLVWVDLDAPQFLSWQIQERQWKSGVQPLPVFQSATDLPKLDAYSIEFVQQPCPEEHQCFLALVATKPGDNPLHPKSWIDKSLLPLSQSAGQRRLPGQQFFLPSEGGDRLVAPGSPFSGGVPTGANMDKEEAAFDDTGAAETEKPDLFRLVGNQLFYANGQAKRFQVIDVSDLSNPRLSGWTELFGSPRELYVLNDYYILLQTNYTEEKGTHLTVLRQADEGTLTTVQDMSLSGQFIESRRRNEVIYTVTQEPVSEQETTDQVCERCFFYQRTKLSIKALRFDAATGQLEEIDKTSLPGYSPTIAIFSDHLVVANHNPEEEKWLTTQIQVLDLSQSEPLVELPLLKVPGQVPSEFHLSVQNQQLRVVYGPENRETGSTLAIYDLTSPDMAVIGQVDQIAPGEALFATRFVDDLAYVVTFERTDPLWVISLSNSAEPKILGELHVPGWSEKMFFHEGRLFAVGYDDQPLEDENDRWVRRIALSLFNVEEPTQPTLINRFTPFAGEVSNTWSPAIDDERALLLNWTEAFAALPINSWQTETGSHLQIVSLANDKVENAGRLDTPIQIQRSVSLAPKVLAALGDQALLTLSWAQDKPELLGELELATNISWLALQEQQLWAAAIGNNGYHRFYRYRTDDVQTPVQRWSLPRGYNGVKADGDWAVFYNTYPSLAVQVLDVKSGKLHSAQTLENQPDSKDETVNSVITPSWYNRSQPLVHDGWFYIAEQRNFHTTAREPISHFILPEKDSWQPEWVLRSWNLTVDQAKEAPIRSIPGMPVAFTADGKLITQESDANGQLRLNLLALPSAGKVELLDSQSLDCGSYSQLLWADDALYLKCEPVYNPSPVYLEEPQAEDDATDSADSNEDKPSPTEPDEPKPTEPTEPVEPSTELLKVDVASEFASTGRWTLTGYYRLQAASNEMVLVSSNGWYGIEPMVGVADAAIMPNYEPGCDVYQLVSEQTPKLLKHLDTCSYSYQGVVLTPTQGWMADGFAGIHEIDWDK
jgi:hypothetical protein